jgi:hypothetical protein
VIQVPSNTSALSAEALLRELQGRGYRLRVLTRVEKVAHKVGSQFITYGEQLRLEGTEPPPEKLRAAIAANLDELLAAACVIDPPVPWIGELAKRNRGAPGHRMETKRLIPYRKRDGTVGLKLAPVTTTVTLQTLAANIAAFISLHPAADGPRLEPIIEEALG